MSIHIELTEEAQTELERMKQKSLYSSIVVSVLSFVLLAILFYTFKIVLMEPPPPPLVAYQPEGSSSPSPDPEEMQPQQESASSQSPTKFITSAVTTAEVSFPPVEFSPEATPHVSNIDLGIGNNGTGNLGNGGGLPTVLTKRCSIEDRLQRIKESGGSEKYEEAVVKTLNWLKSKQNADGSWGSGQKGSMTGLALLVYLAHCETPYSEDYGESCQRAIVFLVGLSKKNNGFLTETPTNKFVPYQHSIATYALAEAYTFCNTLGVPIDGLKESVEKASEIISRSQSPDGSWMYYYRTRESGESYPDLSLSGWNIQAMKAVRHSPARSDADRVLKKAVNFVKGMGDPRTGKFQYKRGDFRDSMAPVGVLSLQMLDASELREAREGLKYIETAIKPEFKDPYAYYYAAQALINRGGSAWKNFGQKMGDVIVSKQNKDGTWPNGSSYTGNTVNAMERSLYFTCLNALTLEVYYRFLPATGERTRNL